MGDQRHDGLTPRTTKGYAIPFPSAGGESEASGEALWPATDPADYAGKAAFWSAFLLR